TRRRTEDDEIFEHASGSPALYIAHCLRVAPQALSQIHPSVITEGVDGDARLQVDLLQVTVGGENQALVGAVGTLPIVETSIRWPAFHRVNPELFARRGIESKDRIVFAHQVHL